MHQRIDEIESRSLNGKIYLDIFQNVLVNDAPYYS